MKKFEKLEDIPEFPVVKNGEYQKVIEDFINAGAIPKKNLIAGGWYIGQSRNTNIAQWFPKGGFHFPRYKFSGKYIDNIPHFEDVTDSTDVFVPFKIIEDLL